jgi:hypothetical protein
MSGSTETSSIKTPLDVAQKIVAELQGMAPEHQALALKFSMEALGLQLQTSAVSHGRSALPDHRCTIQRRRSPALGTQRTSRHLRRLKHLNLISNSLPLSHIFINLKCRLSNAKRLSTSRQ